MRGRWLAALAGGLTLAWVSTSLGHTLDDVRVEWWTGTGAHRALLVVDFWPYNDDGDSFAFGYRFESETITGRDLLNALVATNLGFTYAESGGFLTDIWYVDGDVNYHAAYDWPTSYVSYWVSTDFGTTWDYSMWGIDGRVLQDGDTDGWLGQPGDDYTSVPVTPLLPPIVPGDLDCNGVVSFGDINPFVLALTNPSAYADYFPECSFLAGDVNGDGTTNFGDINPFIALLQR
ncbi:MAG TPA: hypothetical protein PLP66_04160 [Phycisphaerae bacterium]|nr:hypothetical protein [Phycisphaerae bacterium]